MSSYVFDRKKWAELSIFEQMGNIGSEFGRAMSAIKRHDHLALEGALYRGLDLFDATIDSLAERGSVRLREVLIARDQFAEAILCEHNDTKLDEYFTQFAVAAQLRRGL